jgi:hypothetical protein
MTCAKKVDTMLLRKLLYLIVLLQVTGARVLYIMIKCKDKLSRILDLGSTCGHESHGHRPGIIMCEASVRLNLDVVTASDNLALRKIDRIALKDLLRQRLWRCHLLPRRDVRQRWPLEVRMKAETVVEE